VIEFYVYILASKSGVLYTGMTNDLKRRVWEHKQKQVPGFTAKYNVTLLMWYEAFPTAIQAIEMEKRIKVWKREKKIALIESMNRTWKDLAADWYA
jgi:putative endonuclease